MKYLASSSGYISVAFFQTLSFWRWNLICFYPENVKIGLRKALNLKKENKIYPVETYLFPTFRAIVNILQVKREMDVFFI